METSSFSKRVRKLFLVGVLSAITGLAIASAPMTMPWAKTSSGEADHKLVIRSKFDDAVQYGPSKASGKRARAASLGSSTYSKADVDRPPVNLLSQLQESPAFTPVISSVSGSFGSEMGRVPTSAEAASKKATSTNESQAQQVASNDRRGPTVFQPSKGGIQKPNKGGNSTGGGGGVSGGGGGGGGGRGGSGGGSPSYPGVPTPTKPTAPTPTEPTTPTTPTPTEPTTPTTPTPTEPTTPTTSTPTEPTTPDSDNSQLPQIPEVPSVPVPPSESDTRKAVLKEADFEYQGAFALPKTACGWSTGFGESGIAIRRVDGKLRLITATHRYSNDALYEVEIPETVSKDVGKWPEAKMVKEWGFEVYGGKKPGQGWETSGLNYDSRTDRLYWSYGNWYNIPPTNYPSLGFTKLKDTIEAAGPFKTPDAKPEVHNQRTRGGTLSIPDWFAKGYLGGRNLGMGFGGYYSGFGACSKGLHLSAAFQPNDPKYDLDLVTLIDHPGELDHPERWGIRDLDYRDDMNWSPKPTGDYGYWCGMDEVFGGAAWIDLPDKHGVLFISTMGQGRVWYEQSDRHCERKQPWWWVYDPMKLADVALGTKKAWENKPTFWKVNYNPVPKDNMYRTPGCAFDAETRTFFVLSIGAYRDGVEYYPIVHTYKIK